MKIVDKPCKDCAEMMFGVSSLKKVCEECLRKKSVEMQRRARERHRQQAAEREAALAKEQEKKPAMSQLEKDVREAQRCGLTYGQLKLRTARG